MWAKSFKGKIIKYYDHVTSHLEDSIKPLGYRWMFQQFKGAYTGSQILEAHIARFKNLRIYVHILLFEGT